MEEAQAFNKYLASRFLNTHGVIGVEIGVYNGVNSINICNFEWILPK